MRWQYFHIAMSMSKSKSTNLNKLLLRRMRELFTKAYGTHGFRTYLKSSGGSFVHRFLVVVGRLIGKNCLLACMFDHQLLSIFKCWFNSGNGICTSRIPKDWSLLEIKEQMFPSHSFTLSPKTNDSTNWGPSENHPLLKFSTSYKWNSTYSVVWPHTAYIVQSHTLPLC